MVHGEVGSDGAGLTCEPAATFEDDRQGDLFAPRAMLSREVEHALVEGRFDEVRRLRLRIEDEYGPCAETGTLRFADRLESALGRGSPAVALLAWAEIDETLAGNGALRARVRDGAFVRLLRAHPPAALVEAWPSCLVALTHVLIRHGGAPDGVRQARRLVRDALLGGRGLQPLDFRHDPPLADLLAEDLASAWLACLGAIRRLWPVLAAPDTPAGLSSGPAPPSETEPARQFWRCLVVAEDPTTPEEVRQDARRTMKRLAPDLHAQYMRRARGPALPSVGVTM
jgi:hypothetical protein